MVALWETAPSMYNMPTTIEFKGNLDVEILKLAMLHVVRQQEGLRTITKFDMNENEVMQKILPIDLADQCLQFDEMKATNDEEARKLIEKESLFIFNLSKPPGEHEMLVCSAVLSQVTQSSFFTTILLNDKSFELSLCQPPTHSAYYLTSIIWVQMAGRGLNNEGST